MTVRTAPAAAARARLQRTVQIRGLFDRDEIRARLQNAPAYSAFALAYLDRRLFPLASFFEAKAGDRFAILMHARGGPGCSTLTLGEPEAVAALLRLHPGPRQTFLTCETTHIEELLSSHNLWRAQTMLRMQVDRSSFVQAADRRGVRRLLEADADDLNRLYAVEGDGLHYSGRQVGQGIYYGGHVRGRLVAVAGTHIHSLSEGVGVIGNVFTHPDFRGRGLGTAVTGAVAAHLLKVCDLVVLNVDPANRTARHVYESLGFREISRLVEAMATRRNVASPLPLIRRLLARWRSKTALEVINL